MAAITTVIGGNEKLLVVRNATAQATVGQTDWVAPPAWATGMKVYVNWTAKAGTTPLLDFKIHEADPVAKDDSYKVDFAQWDGITQLSAEALVVITVSPGETGIADDDTGAIYKLNSSLAPLMGFATTLDRTSADETYTYTVSVYWTK